MSTTVKIPMNEETRIALEDCFIDTPNMDARKFIFNNLKLACQDAKRSLRQKKTPINQRQDDGSTKQEEYQLKGVKLDEYTLPNDPDWLPEGLDAEDNKPIELKLGDNTMGYIQNFGQLVGIRHEQFNKAEEVYYEKTKAEMLAKNLQEATMEQWEKTQETMREKRLGEIPHSIEEAIFVSINPLIQQKLDMSDGVIFDKEYDEIYKEPEPEKKPAQ